MEHPILGDRFAADAIAHIDYDFRQLKLPSGGEITLPVRAWHFDQWTRAFLAANPKSTVLHLGCGLDTRVYRINPGPQVRWFDVDLPDVIALREQLYPEREGYRRIGASVTDLTWLEGIPGDTPVLVVAEGLVMYLHQKDGVALFRRITEQFPSGEIAFDAYSGTWILLLDFIKRLQSRLTTILCQNKRCPPLTHASARRRVLVCWYRRYPFDMACPIGRGHVFASPEATAAVPKPGGPKCKAILNYVSVIWRVKSSASGNDLLDKPWNQV